MSIHPGSICKYESFAYTCIMPQLPGKVKPLWNRDRSNSNETEAGSLGQITLRRTFLL